MSPDGTRQGLSDAGSGFERHAFRMKLHPGMAQEYRRRHDAIWPELLELLRDAGIRNYAIYLDPETDALFAVMERRSDHGMDGLPSHPVMRRWWAMMADIMEAAPGGAPVAVPLEPMFHMD